MDDKDLQEEVFTSKVLDHLGIVAGVCKEISLVEEIERLLE